MNNETGGKPILQKYKTTPMGGSEGNMSKPGSGGASGSTKYNLRNEEAHYNVSGGPTLGNPVGGPDENASVRSAKPMKKVSAPNMKLGNGGRN